MDNYFKDSWDLMNMDKPKNGSLLLKPLPAPKQKTNSAAKSSPQGGSAAAKSSATKKASSKSSSPSQKEKDKANELWKLTEQMYATEREKDKGITEFKTEMEIFERPDVDDILKNEASLREPFYNDLRTMDKEQAVKKLKSSHEDLEIERGKIPKKNNNEFEYIFSNLLKQHPEIVPIVKNKNANLQDFDVWRADQLIKGAFGDEKDKAYYDQRIKDGSKYNDLRKNTDYDFYVNKGLEMFWGPTINDIKAGKLPDKTLPVYNFTENEKRNYAYLKGKYGEAKAKEYHRFLEDELKIRANEAKEKKAADFADKHPLRATLRIIVNSLISGAESGGNIYRQWLDETVYPELYEPNEVTLADNNLKNSSDSMKNTVQEKLKYDPLMNGYDFALSFVTGQIDDGLSIIKPLIPYVILNNAGDATADFMEKGMPKGKALVGGLISGGAEYLGSNVPIGSNIVKTFVGNHITNTADAIIDTVFMDENSKYYQAFLNNYYNKDMSSFEAQRLANVEAHLLNPFKETFYVNSYNNGNNTEKSMGIEQLRKKVYKSAWDMPEEEFDNYINSIMNQE